MLIPVRHTIKSLKSQRNKAPSWSTLLTAWLWCEEAVLVSESAIVSMLKLQSLLSFLTTFPAKSYSNFECLKPSGFNCLYIPSFHAERRSF